MNSIYSFNESRLMNLNSFHEGGPYHKESSPLICFANQWSGSYNTSDNEAPPISQVLIGRHLIFC